MIRSACAWRLWILLLALSHAAMGLDPHRALDQYGHQVWQTDTGLPQNTIHSILQTGDGYIWLGTEGGLVRFDGVAFVTFDSENTPQLKSDIVYDLLQDRSGALWISTSAGLVRYQSGSFQAFTTAGGLPADAVWFSYQDHSGRIWAITAAGPAYLRGEQFHPVPRMQTAAPESRRALVEDANGTIWLAGASGLFALDASARGNNADPRLSLRLLDGIACDALVIGPAGDIWIGTRQGLERYSHGVLTAVALAGMPPNTEVTSLASDAKGGLWVGTAAGLAHESNKAIVNTREALPAPRIESLFRDRQGALWIATAQGAARLAGNKLESFPPGSKLAGASVLTIFEDREGDIWLGTDASGLNVLRDQKFTTYTVANGLSGDLVRCVFESAAGDIWIGTNGNGLDRRTQNGFAVLTTRDGLSSNIILALAGGSGSDLWIGTPDGLDHLHRGHIEKFTSADGLPDDFIRSLYTGRDGTLWIGTRHGLAHMIGRKFVSYSTLDGLGGDLVGAILNASQGDTWIGTSGGLSRLHHGAFTNYTVKDGLSNSVVTAIHQDAQGALWLGTNGGGLNRLFPGSGSKASIQSFPSNSRTLPGDIYGILEDASGNLWLSSRTGIFTVSRVALNAYAGGSAQSIPVLSYGTADGMKIRECSRGGHPAAWKMTDGTLWFATLEGVSSINPAQAPENRLPPPVVIESFAVDGNVHSLNGASTRSPSSWAVKPGAARLEFHYAGLSFVAPQKVRYRYRLAGFDRGWIDAETRRTAFYTNLPPGGYRFQVLAANNDGVWNQSGASLDFRIQPHFYQTFWFYSTLALAGLLFAYCVYRWRARQVESQWNAVLAERTRLAREIHDTLAQGFVGVSVQLELISRLLATSEESAREQLDRARELVRSSLAEARTSIWQLRSQSDSEDLPNRLARFCGSAAVSSPAKVYLQVKGTFHPFERTIEDQLLRIGQEAVTNAIRHAEATRIDVELSYDGARVCLKIKDNGRGFTGNASAPLGHFGLQGMRERAAEIGAAFSVESTPGEGARISVELPQER